MLTNFRGFIYRIQLKLSLLTGDVINAQWVLVQLWIHAFLFLGSMYVFSIISDYLLLKHSGLTKLYYALSFLVLYDCLRLIFWFKRMAERDFLPKIDDPVNTSLRNDDEWSEFIEDN